MEPIRKTFTPDPLFPFELVYMDTKSPEIELPYHFHEWYEIVYIHDGEGTFFINQSIQNMEKGSVFVIPGNTLHHGIPDVNNPVTSTAIFFNPILIKDHNVGDFFGHLYPFEESLRTNIFKYTLDTEEQASLEKSINTIQLEHKGRKSGYRYAIILELQILLLSLSRVITNSSLETSTTAFSGPTWLNDILKYLEINFVHETSLEELAQYGNVSISHLSRVFKQMTGFNISNYIATKRVIKAKELLLGTDEKVSTIAFQCGFKSLPHFYRTFKKIIHSTPSEFRDKTIN